MHVLQNRLQTFLIVFYGRRRCKQNAPLTLTNGSEVPMVSAALRFLADSTRTFTFAGDGERWTHGSGRRVNRRVYAPRGIIERKLTCSNIDTRTVLEVSSAGGDNIRPRLWRTLPFLYLRSTTPDKKKLIFLVLLIERKRILLSVPWRTRYFVFALRTKHAKHNPHPAPHLRTRPSTTIVFHLLSSSRRCRLCDMENEPG